MRILLLTIFLLAAKIVLAQTNNFPADGNAGIGTLTPLERLSIFGGHSNSRIGLHYVHGQADRDADLLIWASEPGLTYSGVGIGNNVTVNNGFSRLNLFKGGSYIRLLDQEIKLNIIKLDGSDISALSINANGNMGLGTQAPVAKLDVNGSINLLNGHNLTWGGSYGPGIPTIASVIGGGINFYPAGTISGVSMQVNHSGNVLIGKTTQNNIGYKLDVYGKVRASEIVVNTTGADFVFEDSYLLRPLDNLEEFINKHKHLPEIASAKTMTEDGVGLGELQTKLLQKVEELTLYIIEQHKILKGYKQVQEQLQREIFALKENNKSH